MSAGQWEAVATVIILVVITLTGIAWSAERPCMETGKGYICAGGKM